MIICLGPVCLPLIPLVLICFGPIWRFLLPTRLQNYFLNLWASFRGGSADNKKSDEVVETPDELMTFRTVEEINQCDRLFIQFSAPWCGPCKKIKPLFLSLAGKFTQEANFCVIDIDDNQELAISLGVSSIPAFHYYKKGRKVVGFVGADADKLNRLVIGECS